MSSSNIKRVGEAGVYTVEGNVAGGRAARLTKEREKQQQEYEDQKNKVKQINAADLSRINDMFSSGTDSAEQEFRRRTVGLVTADEFRKAREEGQMLQQQEAALLQEEVDRKIASDTAAKVAEKQKKRKKLTATLSFAGGDEEEENEEDFPSAKTVKRSMKDPTIDTSFLPDPVRERELELRREELKREWLEAQERIKNEPLEVVYSYWDGSGHRKSLEVKTGATISKFLELAKQQLLPEFKELRSTNSEDLLFVKEDLIVPSHFSFYDLIITKARGKSGPLFHFDVHEDVRLLSDARVEKDESHPAKIVERRWYERNKHIFPATRWEIYDPTKQVERVGYTIHG